jgi:PAS domain S-box-containing protein
VLGLTVAGFLGARALGERDARRDSERRADVAAAEIRGHVVQGVALAESLRRFIVGVGDGGVTEEQFKGIASSWLSPAGLAGAAWIEQVPASRRATYERRIGRPIVTRDRRGTVAPAPPRSSYLPATLVSGIAPMVLTGLDLGSEPGLTAAVARERTLFDVRATPLATLRDGTSGFFLVESAQRLGRGAVEPGFVVLFVPESWLRAAATDTQRLQLTVGGASSGDLPGVPAVRSAFTEAGQRFEVVVPRRSVQAAAAVMPWIILGSGFVLALLMGALGIYAARRASAQRELDRIFSLSQDLVTVADFDGHFRRVNPAVESILGYTEEEFLSRPYLDFVRPEDRERTAAEAAALSRGQKTVSFENRFVRKDGSHRWLEWTATPVVEERVTYGVARDVTERRQAETDLRAAETRNRTLAEEQAALRRVATLVAGGVSPEAVFAVVAEEVGRLLEVDVTTLTRCEPEDTQVSVGAWSNTEADVPFPVGSRVRLGGRNAVSRVVQTGRPARIDDYADASGMVADAVRPWRVRSAVGVPIDVEGRLWGVMAVASGQERPMPADTEARLAGFTQLVATAIANAQARVDLRGSAEEQAALRRVATLVAQAAPPREVFAAVTVEAGQLLSVDLNALLRFDPGGMATVLGTWTRPGVEPATGVGLRFQLGGRNATTLVSQTGEPSRMDDYADGTGALGASARDIGVRASVGVPVSVEGRLWGVMIVSSRSDPIPVDTEARLAGFTELVATAIANAETQAALTASRARIVAAADAARRRIERNLHDGAQQRLVSLALNLRSAVHASPLPETRELTAQMDLVADGLTEVLDELREIAHGLHPTALAEGGLRPALKGLARRSAVPVRLDIGVDGRLPEPIELAVYYVVAEALANTVKHAHATVIDVQASAGDGVLRVAVRDDGRGGADPTGGSGLVGLTDRVEALGGRLTFNSPSGGGTALEVVLPLPPDWGHPPKEELP